MFKIHHPPKGEATVADFQIAINGIPTEAWFCRVSAYPYNTPWPGCQRPLDQTEIASFVSFEADEAVTVTLTSAKDFSEVIVRPLSRKIVPQVSGRKIKFTITKMGQYTVELDGYHCALHIFANPATDFGVDKTAPNVTYLAPGIHELGDVELTEGQTLFIDGGAVLYGSVTAIHKNNVRIVGYGVIDGSREVRTDTTGLLVYHYTKDLRDEATLREALAEQDVLNGCVRLYSCRNSEVFGVILRDSASFAAIIADCEFCECTWVKTIGMWRYNSDGIDLFNSRYVRVADCFLRDFDDCMVIKGIKGWDKANQHHILVEGCTIWCDWGRGLELGAETCADEYHDIIWIDCDLIHGTHIHIDLQNGDRAHIHDMLVKNIRCEYSPNEPFPEIQHDMSVNDYDPHKYPWQTILIDSPIFDGPWSEDRILGQTSRVRFEDIQILGHKNETVPECRFRGAAEGHGNEAIVIENVSFHGRRLAPEEIIVQKGEFDRNILVR